MNSKRKIQQIKLERNKKALKSQKQELRKEKDKTNNVTYGKSEHGLFNSAGIRRQISVLIVVAGKQKLLSQRDRKSVV